MPYVTPSQIKRRFPQFTADQWGSPPLPDDAELNRIIAHADERVDDYCRAAYVVPFAFQEGYTFPTTISDLALDLCMYDVRRLLLGLSPVPDETAHADLKLALGTLEKIGKGLPPVLDWPRAPSGTETRPGPVLHSFPEDTDRRHSMDWDP